MRRWKIDPSFIEVGDRIRVAGDLARRVENSLYIRNILTSSGEEVVLGKHWVWFPDAEVGVYDCSRAAED